MSRPALVRRALAAAVLPLALTSLNGCGSDDGATAQDSAGSASSSPSAQDAPEAGATVAPADFVDKFRGAFDTITTAHTTMQTQVMGGTLTGAGDVDYSQAKPAASMVMSGQMLGPGKLEVRIVDNVMYLNLGQVTQGKFVKLDLSDPNNPMGASFAESMDPSRAMDALESALQDVTYVGEDSHGQHYRATVETAAMLKNMGQNVPGGASMPKTMTYDAWFDDQGRFTHMEMDMGTLGTTEMTLSDFGADVTVEAPPASQITKQGLRMAG